MTEGENVLVECVPNFSEGRRVDVIAALVASVEAVTGVRVLDQHSDADHNRTVITFVGAPQAVVEAAYQAMCTAAQHIDMDEHHGQHPRLGATDVVPFVPISGVTLADCAGLARQFGERVGRDLGIPVYLYEAAAAQLGRVNLAEVRRGEYEALKQTIGTDPDRKPDFGPLQVGKAGATAIGARMPLVAYNIYLTTDDVTIAQHIARSVRHSGGGLAHVKALGLLVGGRAQVSMNLTDTTQTPIHRVVELVRLEAARYGTAIHSTELVGLIPQAALVDAARWYLQLDGFSADQILEDRLRSTLD